MAKRKKVLIRPKKGRIFAGVCKGLADYFGVSVVLVRIITLILFFPGGLPGFFPYLLLWLIIPSEE